MAPCCFTQQALRTQHTVRRTYSRARFHTRLHTAAQAKHVRFPTVSARRTVEPQKARMASLSCIETNGDTMVHTPLRTRLHTQLLTARPHCFSSDTASAQTPSPALLAASRCGGRACLVPNAPGAPESKPLRWIQSLLRLVGKLIAALLARRIVQALIQSPDLASKVFEGYHQRARVDGERS